MKLTKQPLRSLVNIDRAVGKKMKVTHMLIMLMLSMPGYCMAKSVNIAGDVEALQVLKDGEVVVYFAKPHSNQSGCEHNQRALIKRDHKNFTAIYDLAKLSLIYGHRISFGTIGCTKAQETSYPDIMTAKFTK